MWYAFEKESDQFITIIHILLYIILDSINRSTLIHFFASKRLLYVQYSIEFNPI